MRGLLTQPVLINAPTKLRKVLKKYQEVQVQYERKKRDREGDSRDKQTQNTVRETAKKGIFF